jgi:hypothetical protein
MASVLLSHGERFVEAQNSDMAYGNTQYGFLDSVPGMRIVMTSQGWRSELWARQQWKRGFLEGTKDHWNALFGKDIFAPETYFCKPLEALRLSAERWQAGMKGKERRTKLKEATEAKALAIGEALLAEEDEEKKAATAAATATPAEDGLGKRKKKRNKKKGKGKKNGHVCAADGCGSLSAALQCGRCQGVWYCDRACQKRDWPTHGQKCERQLAAQAAREARAVVQTLGGEARAGVRVVIGAECGANEEVCTEGKGLSSSIPYEYLCPITLELMRDPVFALDGHTYERAAIEDWFAQSKDGKSTSPKTRDEIGRHLVPAHGTNALITDYLAKCIEEKDVDVEEGGPKVESALASLLQHLNLGQYKSAFAQEGYDELNDVQHMSVDELVADIEMKKGHAKRLLRHFSICVAQCSRNGSWRTDRLTPSSSSKQQQQQQQAASSKQQQQQQQGASSKQQQQQAAAASSKQQAAAAAASSSSKQQAASSSSSRH